MAAASFPVSAAFFPRWGFGWGLVLLVVLLAGGCEKSDENARKDREAAKKTRSLFQVHGQVDLEDGLDPTGVQVFLAGTSFGAFCDSSGVFTISDVPAGEYTAYAKQDGYEMERLGEVRADLNGERDISVPSATLWKKPDPEPAQPAAPPVGDVLGRVALADGAPPEGVQVSRGNRQVETDSGGNFAFYDLQAGDQTLQFSKSGYRPFQLRVTVPEGGVLRLSERVELAVLPSEEEPGLSIFGQVLLQKQNGQFVEEVHGATVGLVETGETQSVGADGKFEFRYLKPVRYTLVAQVPGYRQVEPVQVLASEEEPVVTVLVMQEKGDLSEETGAVVGRILLNGTEEGNGGVLVAMVGSSSTGVTNRRGFFRLRHVEPGRQYFLASKEGFKDLEQEGVEVQAGLETDLGILEMESSAEPPRLIEASLGRNDTIVRRMENTIRLTFSKSMNPASLERAVRVSPGCNFTVRPLRAAEEPGAVFEVVFQNSQGGNILEFDTPYTLSVSREARDREGLFLEEALSLPFRVGGLEVIATIPPDGAEDYTISTQTPIIIRFNGPVDPETLNQRSVNLRPDPAVLSMVTRTITNRQNGWTSFIYPVTLKPDTRYSLGLESGVRTPDGKRLKPFKFRFRTAPAP